MSTLLVGCVDASDDGENDAFTTADGKADGYNLTEAEALAVMRVAAKHGKDELDAGGVSPRAAENIAKYSAGPDKRRGTADDQQFDSLVELDGISYVGPRTLDALLAFAKTSGTLDEHALGRHDVSVLVPLPASGDLPWKASLAARGGALLPKTVFAQIGQSVFREIDDALEYDALRIVGVRFDPCFTVSLTSACQPQIRIVFQSLGQEGTNDGAIHALYNLSASEFAELTTKLRTLAEAAPQNRAYAPLGVSPALRSQGMTGAYAQKLIEVIASYAGPTTLARMTFVTRTDSRQSQWQLGGFHVKASETGFPGPGPIAIVGSTETLQVISNGGFGGAPRYNLTPGPVDRVGATGLDATGIAGLSSSAKTALNAWALKQELPAQSVPDTTDCASCHVAGHVSGALEAASSQFVTLDRGARATFGAEQQGDNLRAFGYFGDQPMVSIRTANETAAVLRALAQ